jgi:hypothetical protein
VENDPHFFSIKPSSQTSWPDPSGACFDERPSPRHSGHNHFFPRNKTKKTKKILTILESLLIMAFPLPFFFISAAGILSVFLSPLYSFSFTV